MTNEQWSKFGNMYDELESNGIFCTLLSVKNESEDKIEYAISLINNYDYDDYSIQEILNDIETFYDSPLEAIESVYNESIPNESIVDLIPENEMKILENLNKVSGVKIEQIIADMISEGIESFSKSKEPYILENKECVSYNKRWNYR